MASTSVSRSELHERLNQLIKFLAQRTNDRNAIQTRMDAQIAQIKGRHEADILSVSNDIEDTIAQIREIIEENWSLIFSDKSVKLLYGVIASRLVAGKETWDVDAILRVARKLGKVRKLFTWRLIFDLRPGAMQWIANHPEYDENFADCFSKQPDTQSITVKLGLDVPDIDTSHLTASPIPICKIEVGAKS